MLDVKSPTSKVKKNIRMRSREIPKSRSLLTSHANCLAFTFIDSDFIKEFLAFHPLLSQAKLVWPELFSRVTLQQGWKLAVPCIRRAQHILAMSCPRGKVTQLQALGDALKLRQGSLNKIASQPAFSKLLSSRKQLS